MSFPYDGSIPNPSDNPSNDVGTMQSNATSISNLIARDHFPFNNTSGGWHVQVTLPSFSGTTPTTIAGQGAVYVKTDSAGQQALWFIRDGFAGSNVQLTTSKILAPTVAINGCTFLPGGILMQWGRVNTPTDGQTVTFPVMFPNAVFSIVATGQVLLSSVQATCNVLGTNQTNFQLKIPTGAGISYTSVCWMAIGN